MNIYATVGHYHDTDDAPDEPPFDTQLEGDGKCPCGFLTRNGRCLNCEIRQELQNALQAERPQEYQRA